MHRTPAALAALMALPCWRTRWPASLPETSNSLSAPANASGSDASSLKSARRTPTPQGFDHQTAQLAGGASDDDGHVLVLLSWLVVLTVIGHTTPGPPAVTKPATPLLPTGEQAP